MSDYVNWGILATGSIAATFAEALHQVDSADLAATSANLLAVASRTQASADKFGKRWNVPRCYDSYAALAHDPDVDVVYIATPHPYHYDNAKLCLEAGKHVLCEKPLTLNGKQSAELIALAQRNKLFFMEAVWMRYIPAIAKLREWVAEGVLGEIVAVSADFNFHRPFDPNHRLYNRELGGGALLDLGIYPLSLTTMLLGFPASVESHATIGTTGVDESVGLLLRYASGAVGMLTCGLRSNRPIEATIAGTRGYVKLPDFFLRPDHLILHLNGEEPQTHAIPYRGNGYPHEIAEVHACLQSGALESAIMPHAETQQMMELMDQLRAEWGVVYPEE